MQHPALTLLVRRDDLEQPFRIHGRFEIETEPAERPSDAAALLGAEQPQPHGGPCGECRPDRHGLAVVHPVGTLLYGVGDGMAQIELAPLARLAFVAAHDGALHGNRTTDDALQQRPVVAELRERCPFEQREQLRIAHQSRLERLGQTGAEFAVGKRPHECGIAEDETRPGEGSHHVLVSGDIDPVLAADGGVDLPHEGRGDEAEGDAAHVGRGDEARQIGDDAAAGRDEKGRPIGPDTQQFAAQALGPGHRLRPFAPSDEERFAPRRGEFRMAAHHLGVGDHDDPPSRHQPSERLPGGSHADPAPLLRFDMLLHLCSDGPQGARSDKNNAFYPINCYLCAVKNRMFMQKLRNIAIIAHVDHGKTTLVDKMILAGHILRDNSKQASGELILDNNDLERERGITILSKNVSVVYKEYKINIIDTPGHADFGGEVERVLNMCDGVLLLVDAFEGTMPQTRFVLQKALALGKKPIVVINKVDKPNCRPEAVNEQVFDLMFSLGATEEQLDYKTIYGSAKQGWMSHKWNEPTDSIVPLLDTIIDEIPEPAVVEGTPQLLVTSLEYSSYTGRIAVGKLTRGTLRAGQTVTLAKRDGSTMQRAKIRELTVFEGLGKKKVEEVTCGEICAVMGVDGFEIGDTICDAENPEPLPPIAIDEPTMSMLFTINNSPFFGKDGKYVTSRHIKERLDRELEKNLALRVEPGPSADSFTVYGRGVLHLSVLIETMRREGYELQVGQPRVIVKEIDGRRCEPVEEMTVDCPEECSGTVIEMATRRKGTLTNMTSNGDRVRLEFDIPSRGIIGLRSNMLTATAGEAIMTHRLRGFEPWMGDIEMRTNGSIISGETGTAYAYSIDKLQDRGRFFISPMDQVYEGEVIGEHTRSNDITVNVTKAKQLTNMRASGSDDKAVIVPPKIFTLEEALEYIKEDEYVEVTPHALRLRKILLHEVDRKRAGK